MRILLPLLAAAVATPLVAATPTRAANLTCLRSVYAGFLCLTPDGIKRFDRKNSPLRFGRATDIAACGDRIAVLAMRQVFLFDGTIWSKPIDIVGRFGRRISCGPKGAIWVLGPTHVAAWNGRGWKVHSREQMFSQDSAKAGFMGSVAAGPDGRALVLGSRMAAMYDGKAWRLFKSGQGLARRTFLSRAYFDSKGNAWIASLRNLLMYKGRKWEKVPGAGATSFVTGGNDGVIWAGGRRAVYRIQDGRIVRLPLKAFARDGATDARGRLWLATSFGVMVRVGDSWQVRRMDNSDMPDNSITKIVAIGDGGTLPPAKNQPTGAISGRLEWRDGKHMGNARLELCGTPSGYIPRGGSPCTGQPVAYKTMTGKEGTFEIKDVKAGIYRIAVKPEGNTRWILVTLGRRGQVLPGQTRNSGTIRLTIRHRR